MKAISFLEPLDTLTSGMSCHSNSHWTEITIIVQGVKAPLFGEAW